MQQHFATCMSAVCAATAAATPKRIACHAHDYRNLDWAGGGPNYGQSAGSLYGYGLAWKASTIC